MDYLLFRFHTFDAAEVTKEVIENISNRIQPSIQSTQKCDFKRRIQFSRRRRRMNICACYNDVFPDPGRTNCHRTSSRFCDGVIRSLGECEADRKSAKKQTVISKERSTLFPRLVYLPTH